MWHRCAALDQRARGLRECGYARLEVVEHTYENEVDLTYVAGHLRSAMSESTLPPEREAEFEAGLNDALRPYLQQGPLIETDRGDGFDRDRLFTVKVQRGRLSWPIAVPWSARAADGLRPASTSRRDFPAPDWTAPLRAVGRTPASPARALASGAAEHVPLWATNQQRDVVPSQDCLHQQTRPFSRPSVARGRSYSRVTAPPHGWQHP